MKYWLMKSEPDSFSIEDLEKSKNQTSMWDGVRNYQARNMMHKEMQKGDLVFFYHSNAKPSPGIAGIAQIDSDKAYPDPTQFDPQSKYYDPKSSQENPRWFLVDVKLIKKLPQIVSLERIKKNHKLSQMALVQKGSRLSIQKVTEEEWAEIQEMIKQA